MFTVYGTKKFLDRVGPPDRTPPERPSTTVLGDWFATVLFWRPQVALFVNEPTLLPVLMPLAPAATVVERFPQALSVALDAQDIDRAVIEREVAAMSEHRLAKTNNRSVVGVMNEFVHLGEHHRADVGDYDLTGLARWLAETPCGPLSGGHVSPDRELAAFVAEQSS